LVNVAVDVTSPKSICGCGLGDFSKGASPPVAASMPRPSTEKAHQLRIGYRAGDMWAPHLPAKEALQTEAEHFIDCLCRGASPISSGLTRLHVGIAIAHYPNFLAERPRGNRRSNAAELQPPAQTRRRRPVAANFDRNDCRS
jgi:hypothetical protein